jgi:hypothetical protein
MFFFHMHSEKDLFWYSFLYLKTGHATKKDTIPHLSQKRRWKNEAISGQTCHKMSLTLEFIQIPKRITDKLLSVLLVHSPKWSLLSLKIAYIYEPPWRRVYNPVNLMG